MKHKVREWGRRYVPAEILGTILAMAAAGFAFYTTQNSIITAYAGTWGENLGYYSSIIVRDASNARKRGKFSIRKIIRNLIIEFGPAETLDSFIVRPFCMFVFPIMLNNLPLGILVGKLAADVVFYIPTIISYETKKKYIKD